MEELLISPYLLALFFFVISTVYSSVGLGGGSSYTALMAVFGVSYKIIPTISLTMNIVVTLLGSVNYIRAGHARAKMIAAFIATSVPMAYVGGLLQVEQRLFQLILITTLALVGARIYLWPEPRLELNLGQGARVVLSLVIGAILGFVSGVVGIGGGIFLVPLIIILGLGNEKEAAAAGAIFILLNSMAGLGAHLQRQLPSLMDLAPLVAAVIAGGFLGSHLGAFRLGRSMARHLVGLVVLIAVVLLTVRLF